MELFLEMNFRLTHSRGGRALQRRYEAGQLRKVEAADETRELS